MLHNTEDYSLGHSYYLRKAVLSYVAVALVGSSSLSALSPGNSLLRKGVQIFFVVVAQAATCKLGLIQQS